MCRELCCHHALTFRLRSQRTDSLEFRVEFVVQSYLNFIFVDPPFDPQARQHLMTWHMLLPLSVVHLAAC